MEMLKHLKLFCSLILLCYVPCFSQELLYSTPANPWSEMIEITCLELTGFKKVGDDAAYSREIEVKSGHHVSLPCSYCGSDDEKLPRTWMRKLRAVNSTMEEYGVSPLFNFSHIKFDLYPNHTLAIYNVEASDGGLYICADLLADMQYMFKYSLDVIESDISVVTADTSSWEAYNADTITSATEEIYYDKRFKELLENVKVKVVSEWDPWMPCDGCAGVRRRFAKCRVRTSLKNANPASSSSANLTDSELLLINSTGISCHSAFLAERFPDLGSLTGSLPDYVVTQKCYDSCVRNEWKVMGLKAKYILNIKMELGSSLSFDCPETVLTSNIIWKKNGLTIHPITFMKTEKSIKKYLKNMFKKNVELPHEFVDHMNILQLSQVQFEQTADYMCFVDKSIMKVIHVNVTTPWETLRERHYNFWLLSIYTFLVSASIVSMAILWAILNRHLFISTTEVI
ncbi:putative tubulin polyglutamylase ttll1 [Homalodisca vitripennis]|nr:putative tubulin polyglutamylase ttll1 [Homalodisca vitripennis]